MDKSVVHNVGDADQIKKANLLRRFKEKEALQDIRNIYPVLSIYIYFLLYFGISLCDPDYAEPWFPVGTKPRNTIYPPQRRKSKADLQESIQMSFYFLHLIRFPFLPSSRILLICKHTEWRACYPVHLPGSTWLYRSQRDSALVALWIEVSPSIGMNPLEGFIWAVLGSPFSWR